MYVGGGWDAGPFSRLSKSLGELLENICLDRQCTQIGNIHHQRPYIRRRDPYPALSRFYPANRN